MGGGGGGYPIRAKPPIKGGEKSMKKWLKSLTVIAALALVIVPCCLFSACSSDHTPTKGDTYVFAKIEYQWAEGVTDEQKNEMEAAVEAMSKDTQLVFTSQTDVEMKMKMTIPGESQTMEMTNRGTYTVANGKVTITMTTEGQSSSKEFTIKGNTLVVEDTQNGSTMTITYQLQK